MRHTVIWLYWGGTNYTAILHFFLMLKIKDALFQPLFLCVGCASQGAWGGVQRNYDITNWGGARMGLKCLFSFLYNKVLSPL